MQELGFLADFVRAIPIVGKAIERSPQKVAADLRLLRFGDEGTLGLLIAARDGTPVDEEVANRVMTAFNDKYWDVSLALERLAEDFPTISRRMRQKLASVADEKSGVRARVQHALFPWHARGLRLPASQAGEIIAAVEQLNNAIDEAEHAILHGGGNG